MGHTHPAVHPIRWFADASCPPLHFCVLATCAGPASKAESRGIMVGWYGPRPGSLAGPLAQDPLRWHAQEARASLCAGGGRHGPCRPSSRNGKALPARTAGGPRPRVANVYTLKRTPIAKGRRVSAPLTVIQGAL